MEGTDHLFPQIWQGKPNPPLGADRQYSSFNFNVWVAIATGTILQVWSGSYSITKIKAKKELLKTEKRKISPGLGKERQEALA